MTQQYGPNQTGYYAGMQNIGGYNCQTYSVPQGGCSQCGGGQQYYGGGQQYYGGQQQYYVVAPQNAYLPQYGLNGMQGNQGNSFYMSVGGSW